MRETSSMKQGRAPRAIVGFVVGTSVLLAAPLARAQRVVVSLGYRQVAPAAIAPPAGPPGGAPGGYPLPGQVALGQAAAYAQYLQYLAYVDYQAAHGGPPTTKEAAQYFTNGAGATSVPSAGPGSAYFTNGAEATVPPVPSAAPAQPALPPAPYPAAPIPTPAPPPTPPPAPAPAPAFVAPLDASEARAVGAEAEAHAPPSAMSFEAWVHSMGLDVAPVKAAEAAVATNTETEPVTETSAASVAYEVPHREPYAFVEKPREHTGTEGGSGGLIALVMGAFATGLLIGGLAMVRLTDRFRRLDDPSLAPVISPPVSEPPPARSVASSRGSVPPSRSGSPLPSSPPSRSGPAAPSSRGGSSSRS